MLALLCPIAVIGCLEGPLETEDEAAMLATCPAQYPRTGDADVSPYEPAWSPFGCFGACGPSCDAVCTEGSAEERLVHPVTLDDGKTASCQYSWKACKTHETCARHDSCVVGCTWLARSDWAPEVIACVRACDVSIGSWSLGADYSNVWPLDRAVGAPGAPDSFAGGAASHAMRGAVTIATDVGRGGVGDIRPSGWNGEAVVYTRLVGATAGAVPASPWPSQASHPVAGWAEEDAGYTAIRMKEAGAAAQERSSWLSGALPVPGRSPWVDPPR